VVGGASGLDSPELLAVDIVDWETRAETEGAGLRAERLMPRGAMAAPAAAAAD
jgi:hypothetical protein